MILIMSGSLVPLQAVKKRNQYPLNISAAGFTLTEVAIAVALFGLALSTLVTLQSRIIDNYYREQNLIQATLYAQYLMAKIEAAAEPPEATGTSGDLYEALREEGYFDDAFLEDEEDSLDGWTYEQNVTEIGVPPFDDVMRRIDLSIRWGEGEKDQYTLVYFVRSSDQLPQLPRAFTP